MPATESMNHFDVLIIGGSYAGLSAAMSLGRSLRNVLIIDSGQPCNRFTPHSHNFLTQDGEAPSVIARTAREQVLKYPTVQLITDTAVEVLKEEAGFTLGTESGKKYTGKKIILSYGIKDILPAIKGLSECWGKSVIHCPYCHGYEFHGKKTAIMAAGDRAMHLASLVNNLTKNLTILTQGEDAFFPDQHALLAKHAIHVIDEPIQEIKHDDGQVKEIIFENGTTESYDAVYAAVPFVQHSDVAMQLNCEFTETGLVKIDHLQQTTVEGVYACGDNSNMMRSVANAVYAGNLAGAMVNKELVDESWNDSI